MSGSSSDPPWGNTEQHCRRNKPDWMLGPDDLGQVMVLMLRRKLSETASNNPKNQDAPLPDPFVVGASIELEIGAEETRKLKASREGRGSRYLLRSSSKTVVEKLTQMTQLSDGTHIEIVPHPTLNTVQGVVYDPDSIEKDEQAIQKHLASQGVHTVRRIKKRVNGSLKNTPLLVLSFHGTIVPDHVFFGLLRIQVRVYYPTPMICFNCGYYGHSKKFCQQPTICLHCSTSHTVSEGDQCTNPVNCLHCNAGHKVTSRDCPKYREEEKIVRVKIDQGVSFAEARRICTEVHKKDTFSEVVQEQIKKELAAKDQLISTLQKQVALMEKELATLKKTLKSSPGNQFTAPRDPPSQILPSTSTQSQNSTERKSRKDKQFISPPANRRGSHKNNKSEHHAITRSRSGKRHIEISPTETNSNRGKRPLSQLNTSNTTTDIDMDNGPGTE